MQEGLFAGRLSPLAATAARTWTHLTPVHHQRGSSAAGRPPAAVTVVIPARDEAATIGPLLEGLLAQTLPAGEIIVVDAGSTDSTAEIVRGYAGRGVRLLEIGPGFPGRARNRGIDEARYDWVALIDAGCIPRPEWLAALDVGRAVLCSEPGVVWGRCDLAVNSAWEEAQALVIGPARRRNDQPTPPLIASSLIHREVWRRAGRFREDLRAAEDLLFFDALRQARARETHALSAGVSWQLAPSVGAFYRRLRTYSRYHAGCGLWTSWHLRVGLMDLTAVALVALATQFLWALPLLGLAVALRLVKTVWERRGNVAASPWRLACLARVGILVALADLAMWNGLADLALEPLPPR
jgi:glycosyltransferase involved in cell wall biosynthesis